MKQTVMTPTHFLDAKRLVKEICVGKQGRHPIPLENSQRVRAFVQQVGDESGFFVASYQKGEEMVTRGAFTDRELQVVPGLQYAFVPLGFILKGEITVIKDHKGLKKLSEGDFFGLFETSDFLSTGETRQIGDWTLVAATDAEVLYFDSSVFQNKSVETEIFKNYLIELARADWVPQRLSSLPLLDWVANHTTKGRLEDYTIIAHTHLLPNNKPLFRHLASLVDFGGVYIFDKPYSTVPATFNDLVLAGFEVIPVRMETGLPYEFAVNKSLDVLWRKVVSDQKKRGFKKLLIIDDGGDVWQSIPWDELKGVHVAAVEQTQRGIARIEGSKATFPPIVSVASAGVKKIVEAEFIGISVVKKLNELGVLNQAKKVGIIGMGSIGLAVDRALKTQNIIALSYDPIYHVTPSDSLEARASLDALLNECDLVIGTTGTDALRGLPFERVRNKKVVLASASSADIEFGSLLKIAPPHSDPFGALTIPIHEKLTVEILNGGYPVNFDRQKDSTPDEDIVLTRCLMYIGAMQAVELIETGVKKSAIYHLDKTSQTKLLERWIEDKTKAGHTPFITQEDVERIVSFTSLKGGKEGSEVWKN